MENKNKLIEQILDLELEMFLTVSSRQRAACQEQPESFRLHRGAQFSVWSEMTLNSYLDDLKRAKLEGTNLMTIKYARMENLIPKQNKSPLIDKIVTIHYEWQQEMIKKYPNLMAGARPLSSVDDGTYQTSFETYLRGELETYSENTLSLLYDDMIQKQENGINMSEEVYINLVRELGYSSLKQVDEKKE
jgi:hypothetical protein